MKSAGEKLASKYPIVGHINELRSIAATIRAATGAKGSSAVAPRKFREILKLRMDKLLMSIDQGKAHADNIHVIVTHLRSKLSGKRRGQGKPICLASLATYLYNSICVLTFAARRGKRLQHMSQADYEEISRKCSNSRSLLAEILETRKGTGSDLGWKTLRSRANIRKKNRVLLTYKLVKCSGEIFEALSPSEQMVLLLAKEMKMRASEIVCARIEHIKFDQLLSRIKVVGKGSKTRLIPFRPKTIAMLMKLIDGQSEGYLLHKADGSPYTSRGADKIARRALGKLGIEEDHIHSCRHLGANDEIMQGKDLDVVSDEVGHSSVTTTKHEYEHCQAHIAYNILDSKQFMFDVIDPDFRIVVLTAHDAATKLGVGVREIQNLAKEGHLIGQKVNGKWLFRKSEISRHMLLRRR